MRRAADGAHRRYGENASIRPSSASSCRVTHVFTPNPGGVLDSSGKVVPEARDLADRGVWLDTAQGRLNFVFDVARRVLDHGLVPDCISTDLTIPGRQVSVHSLVEMMGRFLGLRFTLEQVITMCTANPARAIGEQERLGSLRVGRRADISVLELRQGDWVV
jgi:dihydroorotase